MLSVSEAAEDYVWAVEGPFVVQHSTVSFFCLCSGGGTARAAVPRALGSEPDHERICAYGRSNLGLDFRFEVFYKAHANATT